MSPKTAPLQTLLETPATEAAMRQYEALRQDFTALLEESFQRELKPGAVAIGEILKIEKDGLVVNVGGKSEGLVPFKEIPSCFSLEDLEKRFAVGQIKEFFVIGEYDEEYQFLLSIRRVAAFKNWDRLVELKHENATVDVTVTGSTKGGILVQVLDLKGFIPASQLRVARTLNELIGETLPAKILEVEKSKNKLILSHRAAIFEQMSAMRAETINKLHQGDIVEGEIVKITDFGAFVDINGIDGLLPLSEISWRRINHPSEILELGQIITVKVLTVDEKLQRISLSRKRLETDPWDRVHESYKVGDEVTGRASKMLTSGVLIELSPGIEAYCTYGYHHNNSESRPFIINGTYTFKIISISAHDRRITLEYLRS